MDEGAEAEDVASPRSNALVVEDAATGLAGVASGRVEYSCFNCSCGAVAEQSQEQSPFREA